jgi:hypothetical protein
MTEADWLTWASPTPMLQMLDHRGKPSRRKLRLFAVACCRRVQQLISNLQSLKHLSFVDMLDDTLAVAEKFAEGKATKREAKIASTNALSLEFENRVSLTMLAVIAAGYAASEEAPDSPETRWDAHFDEREDDFYSWAAASASYANRASRRPPPLRHRVFQERVLRDIFGNPFRPVTLGQFRLTPTAKQLAEAIYNERAFDRMPILADALEEAGCTNADILAHCRQPGPHARGCWVIDALLGKE